MYTYVQKKSKRRRGGRCEVDGYIADGDIIEIVVDNGGESGKVVRSSAPCLAGRQDFESWQRCNPRVKELDSVVFSTKK